MAGREEARLNKKRLIISIPASVISDTPHLREKTAKLGLIGRAAAIFRVDEIVVYRDSQKEKQTAELDLIATLLSYLETPQYLRKSLFKIEPRLQYAGILPPLRTPHHPVNRKAKVLKVGEYVEGLVTSSVKEGLQVDVGVESPALLRDRQYPVGERLTLQIVKAGERIEVQAVNRGDVTEYWGYTVAVEYGSLRGVMNRVRADLTIGTSRKASFFADIAEKVADKWKSASSILLVFGAPSRGLNEIARNEGWQLREFVDFVVNTIPRQGTETVRTEEAVLASLAILNVWFGF